MNFVIIFISYFFLSKQKRKKEREKTQIWI